VTRERERERERVSDWSSGEEGDDVSVGSATYDRLKNERFN
jgi:hypothetical protein